MRERILHLTRDDFEWQYFTAGGKGGQKQNKTATGVRCVHRPSGAAAESRTHRTQWANRKEAFVRCARSTEFQRWIRLEHARVIGRIDAAVEEAMRPENLLIEYGPFPD